MNYATSEVTASSRFRNSRNQILFYKRSRSSYIFFLLFWNLLNWSKLNSLEWSVVWKGKTLCTGRVFGFSLKSGHLSCNCRIFSHLHLLVASPHDSISPPFSFLDAWSSSLNSVFSNIRTSGTLFSTFPWLWWHSAVRWNKCDSSARYTATLYGRAVS